MRGGLSAWSSDQDALTHGNPPSGNRCRFRASSRDEDCGDQNVRTITDHAGKTRRLLIHEAAGSKVREVARLDLPKEQSFQELAGYAAHPIDGVDVLITASCGDHFSARFARRGIGVLATRETDPETAVHLTSTGGLLPPAERHDHHTRSIFGRSPCRCSCRVVERALTVITPEGAGWRSADAPGRRVFVVGVGLRRPGLNFPSSFCSDSQTVPIEC